MNPFFCPLVSRDTTQMRGIERTFYTAYIEWPQFYLSLLFNGQRAADKRANSFWQLSL